jgi:hypothetical protein
MRPPYSLSPIVFSHYLLLTIWATQFPERIIFNAI